MSVNEIGYQRGGGFYGAGLWFSGAPINGQEALSYLLRAADALKKLAVEQGAFQRRIAEIELMLGPTVEPFRSLFNGSGVAGGGCLPSERESLAFIGADGAGVVEVFEWAQRSSSAAAFSKVIFGSPAQRPEGGRLSQERIFRSLALAIEYAHKTRVTFLGNEIENLQRQVARSEANLRAQMDRCRSLEQSNRELESKIRTLYQHLQDPYQIQVRNPRSPVAPAPLSYGEGEPPESTWPTVTPSTHQPFRGQHSNEGTGLGHRETRPPVGSSGSLWRVISIVLFICLAVVVLGILYLSSELKKKPVDEWEGKRPFSSQTEQRGDP